MLWKETKVIATVKNGNWCFADLWRDFNKSRNPDIII